MSNLRNLALLNLVQNEFETLEVHLCTITTLTDLRVSHNKIHTVHQEVGLLKHLTRGDFDGNKLVTMPEGIGGCTALTHLNVAGNVLEALPEGMKHHTLLTCLDVTGNNLRMLPTGIGMCKNLDDFEYEDNPFDAIPPEILKQGSKLLIDYLSRFCIAGPPPGYEHIVGAFDGKTRSLNLDNLQLEHVPPYVYGLGYIEELSCKRNAIVDLPSEISLLRNLKKLRLESNLLRSLPLELCLCPLDELDLLFNNWEEPPAEVRDKGCKVILKYLQAQYISLKVGLGFRVWGLGHPEVSAGSVHLLSRFVFTTRRPPVLSSILSSRHIPLNTQNLISSTHPYIPQTPYPATSHMEFIVRF